MAARDRAAVGIQPFIVRRYPHTLTPRQNLDGAPLVPPREIGVVGGAARAPAPRPPCSPTPFVAGIGPIPISPGSTPAKGNAWRPIFGSKPSSLAASPEAR